ncbi:hypothetical protein FRC12_014557 [Ceratobasidium sp. 428]|nr:hypothetical protein FRC12_014557 [Ceratobasidium sp. 428]
MSDELSHPWGIPIEAYIQTLDKPRLNKRAPSRTEVISALQKVYNQSLSVSWTTFEDILAVVLYPDEMTEIAQRSNALSSSCIKLLRDHSAQAGGLLSYQYGYSGLRVLILSLLITFVGHTSPGETAQFDYEQENVDEIMRQLTAKASLRLTFGFSLHAAPPENIWHRSSDPRSLSSLMDWNGNMTNIELDDLFNLLVAERSSFFNLCHLLQDTRGWALLLFVLWIRVAPWCGPGNKIAMYVPMSIRCAVSTDSRISAPLRRLYQLNDILGRYCLAATHDPTLTIAYPLARWMSYKLLPLVGTPSFCPSPVDLAELPRMKRIVFTQLKATEAFEGDPPSVDRLTVSLGFITGYQTYSGLLDDLDLQLTDIAFARLWAAVQSDRTFAGDGMVGRYDICKLAYAVLRNVSFTML